MAKKITVKPVNGALVPFIRDDGSIAPGRMVGIDSHTGESMPDGEQVTDHPQIRKAIVRGHLELIEE